MRGVNTGAVIAWLCAAGTCIVLGLATWAVHYQDQAPQKKLLDTYMNSPLFSAEKVMYIDYRQRLVSIYQRGYQDDVESLRRLRQEDPTRFARVILNDRSFYPYVKARGRLYFEPKSYQDWLLLRQELSSDYQQALLAPRLSLTPESFGPVQLLSYPFAEQSLARLMTEIMLLMGAMVVVIYLLGAGRCASVALLGIAVGGGSYGVLAGLHEPALQGWSMALLALLGASGAHAARELSGQQEGAVRKRGIYGLAASVLVIVLVLSLHVLLWQEPLAFVVAGLMAVLTGGVVRIWLGVPVPAEDAEHADKAKAWQYRVDLARAMESIAQLRFEEARRQLKAMVRRHPEEIEVIRHLYLVEKLWPQEETYWACAQELIHFAVRHNHYDLALMLFQDIQQHAATKELARQRLAPEFYHKMMMIFVHHNDLNRAEQSFLFLELAGHSEIIKDACLLLKEEFKQRRDAGKMQQYELLMQQL